MTKHGNAGPRRQTHITAPVHVAGLSELDSNELLSDRSHHAQDLPLPGRSSEHHRCPIVHEEEAKAEETILIMSPRSSSGHHSYKYDNKSLDSGRKAQLRHSSGLV